LCEIFYFPFNETYPRFSNIFVDSKIPNAKTKTSLRAAQCALANATEFPDVHYCWRDALSNVINTVHSEFLSRVVIETCLIINAVIRERKDSNYAVNGISAIEYAKNKAHDLDPGTIMLGNYEILVFNMRQSVYVNCNNCEDVS